jgi:hypothetical protein
MENIRTPHYARGRWTFTLTEQEPDGLPKVYDGDKLEIAEVHGKDNTEREATARLMALAPELLDQLKTAVMFLKAVPADVMKAVQEDLDTTLYVFEMESFIADADGR